MNRATKLSEKLSQILEEDDFPKTYGELKKSKSWKRKDSALTRSYVSRKEDENTFSVHKASDKGSRKGQIYVDLPNPKSSTYSLRQYFIKESQEKLLMNPHTGSVASESEWKDDYKSTSLKEWGGKTFEDAGLVEVKPDGRGGYREV